MVLATTHRSAVNAIDAFEHVKHSTTAVEHACKIVRDSFVLLNVQAQWAKTMTGHLTGTIQLIDAAQWIFPVHHFFFKVEEGENSYYAYERCTQAFNVFMGGHLFVSAFDVYHFFADSGAVAFAKHAANLGRQFPVLKALRHIPINPLINVGVLTMFSALAKDSWDTLWSDDSRDEQKKAALCNLVYSTGIVTITLIGMVSAQSMVPLNFTIQVVGLVGTVYGAYNP